MGLIRLTRCKGSTTKLRLRNSFWTSVGAVVALFALTLVAKPGVHPGADLVDLLFSESEPVSLPFSRTEAEEIPSERRLQDPCNAAEPDDLYPDDWFITKPYREDPARYGKIFIHIILIGYMLLGLNTVCDVYFTGAIEILVDAFGMTADVAGATFMAAGGSAPELFTSLIGATMAMNDVGFGTIVGSAVFNVLFVIGLCGYAATEEIKLSWWPLFRDCTFYIVSLGVLAACAANKAINLTEAIILFLMYILYCVIMSKNTELNLLVDSMVAKKIAPQDSYAPSSENGKGVEDSNPTPYGKMTEEVGDPPKPPVVVEDNDPDPESTPEKTPEVPERPRQENAENAENAVIEEEGKNQAETAEPEDEDAEDEDEDYWAMPEGNFKRVIWALSMPIYGPLCASFAYVHFPKDKAEERFKSFFMVVFFQSLVWIAAFAYFLVWWVTVVFVDVLEFSVTVMGFTLLAAGTSIPDAVSSVVVARKGEGDMAVSSSIGSNIFDILVGLPIPWIIKIGIIEMGIKGVSDAQVNIQSDYIGFYVILLLCMVVCVIVSIHVLGWKLNKALGAMMALLYMIFLAVVLFVEMIYDKHIKEQKIC